MKTHLSFVEGEEITIGCGGGGGDGGGLEEGRRVVSELCHRRQAGGEGDR